MDEQKKEKVELIDISKHIDTNNNKNAFKSKTIIIGMFFLTISILLATTIALLINFFN